MCKNWAQLPGFSTIPKLKVAGGGVWVQPQRDCEQHTRAQEIHVCAHDKVQTATCWFGKGPLHDLPSVYSNPTRFMPSQARRSQSPTTHPIIEALLLDSHPQKSTPGSFLVNTSPSHRKLVVGPRAGPVTRLLRNTESLWNALSTNIRLFSQVLSLRSLERHEL